MPYQVTYTEMGKRRKSKKVYMQRPKAQAYADLLNAGYAKRNARVVKSTQKPNS